MNYLKIDMNTFFDKAKIVENEDDKKRIKENCDFLKSQNIEVLENMLLVPRNFDTFLRSEEYYIAGMLREYLFAVMASSMVGEKEKDEITFCEILKRLIKQYAINEIISREEYEFMIDMYEGKVEPQIVVDASWRYERVAVYLNMLGLKDDLQIGKVTDARKIDAFLYYNNDINLNSLFKKAKLKSKEEILKSADLVFRYKWAAEEARINGTRFQLDEGVLAEQKRAFETLLNWDDKMIRKTKQIEK